MKYMHFRASCAYTALAALLETMGIDAEDDQIALEMKLPWLFAKENGAYIAGPMLQGAKWFNLWLNPRGYAMSEVSVDRGDLLQYLREHCPVMLGIQAPFGKHAVVFKEYDGLYHFFNPTYESSGESTALVLDARQVLASTAPVTVVGSVRACAPQQHDIEPLLEESIKVLKENCAEIESFAAKAHAPDDYFPAMNNLFRPLLLDGITMLNLAGETALAQAFSELQRLFMDFMRGPRTAAMDETVSISRLRDLTAQYIALIMKNA